MITIDLEKALELLEAEVNAAGADFVYTAPGELNLCVYTEVDPETGQVKPSCLLGRALVRAGVDVLALHEYSESGGIGSLLNCNGEDLDVEVEPAAIAAWEEAQEKQDTKHTYGEALAAARAVAAAMPGA